MGSDRLLNFSEDEVGDMTITELFIGILIVMFVLFYYIWTIEKSERQRERLGRIR